MIMMNNNACGSAAPKTDATVRPMAVAGKFYPADKNELCHDIANYFKHTASKQTFLVCWLKRLSCKMSRC
jgi:hypothetical protein